MTKWPIFCNISYCTKSQDTAQVIFQAETQAQFFPLNPSPGGQFNRKNFGLSFGLKNHLSSGYRLAEKSIWRSVWKCVKTQIWMYQLLIWWDFLNFSWLPFWRVFAQIFVHLFVRFFLANWLGTQAWDSVHWEKDCNRVIPVTKIQHPTMSTFHAADMLTPQLCN